MKRTNILRLLLSLALISAPSPISALAQRGMGRRIYNPASEVTIKGTVEEVKEQTCSSCGWNQTGTHLSVKADTETFDVRLGPTRFLANNNFSFAKGDKVELIGSKVKIDNVDAIIAREVKKGDKTLTLRDTQGFPAWAGGRHEVSTKP
jgi:hypothetical protein